ncbi:Carb_anhydrase domain-containing protein [Cephalotus follicularis]|uniref:Carbonic anhydrase n=1 Tax=Cephalotus follicularis TaxID=3775 RepID=A0A1Q3B3W5_CEPFO|nr:Carb_anhydrase domain-containing protein [Cephalotus follicularis]
MAKLATQLLSFSFFIVLIVLLASRPASSQEVEDETEFNYSPDSGKGPAKWGEINPEWSSCKNGTMQSPIDMLNERVDLVSHLGRLKRNYKPSNATLKNRGHDMMLKWEEGGAGYLDINGTEYVLQQCHWHVPSEHRINGKSFDLEVHMVHESRDGKVAVVGIMYTIGRPDSFLASLKDHLSNATDTYAAETVGIVDPRNIKIGSRKYYRYIGSLTVPPCTENVLWTIVRKVRTVTREQMKLLRVAVHDDSGTNARPEQPINGRLVQLFRPDIGEEN